MSLVIRVGRKYALYLPREVVEKLGLHEGDKLLLSIRGDEIVIRPLPRLLKERGYWTETTLEDLERESEEQTRLAEED
ncbi:MAG TPA: AbrB/MazE/SpoVT family DNA-binding domain-containing protein [Pyrodictium sp.]|nr:AbrB/MazE/SpoVT family DNA-binding domain-containing protein [Pyrodictium sp.]